MFSKVLVANRGEIAVRAFRAAVELGAQTVAVFPWEDRNSLHRLKADQSFQIGQTGHPVRAYLSVEEILAAARTAGADAIYPGYGFLSENPDLAEGCARAGITFVGPPADILRLAGNKARAIAAARAAGLPVLASSAVPRECVVIPELVRFQCLEDGVTAWAAQLLCAIDRPRLEPAVANRLVAASAFSIAQSAGALERLYRDGALA